MFMKLFQKFSPSVTSSPSVLSAASLVKTQVSTNSKHCENHREKDIYKEILFLPQPLPPHLTPTTPAKNSSNTKVKFNFFSQT